VLGEKVGAWDAATALGRGIAMMHQELQLVLELTVAQNVFLASSITAPGCSPATKNRRLAGIIEVCGFDLDPSRPGRRPQHLPTSRRSRSCAPWRANARVIVMDEPPRR